jgi:hypothetical protein
MVPIAGASDGATVAIGINTALIQENPCLDRREAAPGVRSWAPAGRGRAAVRSAVPPTLTEQNR